MIQSKPLLPLSGQFHIDLPVWILLLTPIAIYSGTICALFMLFLEYSVSFRFEHGWIIYFLPLAGLLAALLKTDSHRLVNVLEHYPKSFITSLQFQRS